MDGLEIDRALIALQNRLRNESGLPVSYGNDVADYCQSQFEACMQSIDQINLYLDAIGL